MMRIAVIADTHGRFPVSVAGKLKKADEIWHLGDFCDQPTLEAVQAVGRPFFGVLGNNDWGLNLPRHLLLERLGKTFLLVHIPPSRMGGADFLLHGHTHVPRDESFGLTRVLNPGTLGGPRKGAPPSWAWMMLDEKTASVSWTLMQV
jgi:uncharacterized protein